MIKPLVGSDYPIAAVSKLTGVSCHALRIWERRYGFPVPHRSPSGHRRYSHEQVQVLREFAEQMRQGHSIRALIAEFQAGRRDAAAPCPSSAPVVRSCVLELVDLLVAGDCVRAEEGFDRMAHSMSRVDLIQQLVEPALIDIGERWYRGECEISFQERCGTRFVYRKLHCLIAAAQHANIHPQHTILVGTVQGDRHEGGTLIVELLLELAGWRAIGLGVDLPVRDYQKAVECWRPDAVGVSFVLSRNINKRFQELERIRGVPIFVGGRSILNHQSLARRYGLIPLVGSAPCTIQQLFTEYEHWKKDHARPLVESTGLQPRDG